MKTRWKILITILAATLYWVVITYGQEPQLKLKVWYDGYNETYFLGQLPKDTIIEYGDPNFGNEASDNMAITIKEGSKFRIILDRKANYTPVVARETILHESCHIEAWDARDSVDGHGMAWHRCMDRLYSQGAFDGLL